MVEDSLVRDSVVMGNVAVTNNIVISKDALASLSIDEVTNAMSNYYGHSVSIESEGGEKEIIAGIKKIYQNLEIEKKAKKKFKFQQEQLFGINRDLASVEHLRFGHHFDSRKQALTSIYPATTGAFSGEYYDCELVGYDKTNQWVIVWLKRFYAPKKTQGFFQKIFKSSFKDKFDWYAEPINASPSYLCSMDIETFSCVYTVSPIVGKVNYSRFLLDIEKYTILQK